MLALLLSTLISFFLFTTYGLMFTRVLKAPASLVEKLLIGLVVSNTIATIISLFFPVNNIVLLLMIALGCLFLLFIKEDLKLFVISLTERKYVFFLSLPLILLAFTIASGYPDNYDSALYHIQSIKWIEEYSTVPGLANLHSRFGFNPNIFTFFALTSLVDLFHQEIFSVNFSVLSILIFYFMNKMHHLLKQREVSTLFAFYFILLLIILSLPNLSSPSPDFLATALPLFIFARMVDLSGRKAPVTFGSFVPVLILITYIMTVKLSSFPLLILFLFVLIQFKSELRKSLRLLPLLAFIIVPWIIGTVILTGWLVYPVHQLDIFNFDWKVPVESVIRLEEAVRGWARIPGPNHEAVANMVFIDWFPSWWQRLYLCYKVLIVMSILFPIATLIGQLIKIRKIELITSALVLTSLVGVLFWLYFAPAWRFGEVFILTAAMSPLLVFKSNLRPAPTLKFALIILMIFILMYYSLGMSFIHLAVVVPSLGILFYLSATYKPKSIFTALLFILFSTYLTTNYQKIKTNSFHILYSNCAVVPPINKVPSDVNFTTYTISGIDIYTPTKGDKCFNHDLPCTPYPDTTLVLRNTTLKSGFKKK